MIQAIGTQTEIINKFVRFLFIFNNNLLFIIIYEYNEIN